MSADESDRTASSVRCLLALCLVLSGATALLAGAAAPAAADRPAPAATQDDGGENASARGISEVRYTGPGIVTVARNRTYVWQTGNTSLDVVVQPLGEAGSHELCLTLRNGNETDREYGCRTVEVQSYGGATTFGIHGFGNATGNRTLRVDYRRADGTGGNDTERVPVTVVTPEGDVDGDSLSNQAEVKHNTSLVNADTDADGLLDGPEVNEYNSSATAADTDDDGARDGMEVEAGSDPGDPDTDGDGLSDGEELLQHNTDPTMADTDGDGLSDRAEVLEYDTDPTEADTDGDGLSDYAELNEYETDPTEADTDGDGIPDGEEIQRGLDPHEPGTEGPTNDFLNRNTLLFAGLGLALAIGGFAAYLTLDGRRRGPGERNGEVPPPGPPAADRAASGTAPAEAGETAAPGSPATEAAPVPDPDLLSPEEYIRQLLEANGGYMKQSDIVEQVDWSKATVSRRLSSMEEDGLIERTRMGRGKIVTLPDVDLDETP